MTPAPGVSGEREIATAELVVANAFLAIWREHGVCRVLPMTSNSMAPAIRAGDLMLVVGTSEVRVGDVVVRRRGGQLVAHRLVAVTNTAEGPSYRTKGDNNPVDDGPASPDDVIARVVSVERAGRIVDLARPTIRPLNAVLTLLCRRPRRAKGGRSRLLRSIRGGLARAIWVQARRGHLEPHCTDGGQAPA